MSTPYEIRAVEYLGDFRLRVSFADGSVGVVDFAERLAGTLGPVFEPLKSQAFFAQVMVDPELGTIVWPNGADVAPDALYERVVKAASA